MHHQQRTYRENRADPLMGFPVCAPVLYQDIHEPDNVQAIGNRIGDEIVWFYADDDWLAPTTCTSTNADGSFSYTFLNNIETGVAIDQMVSEPSSINLPEMQAGDVFNGEFTLTNYGLIRAEDINFILPADNEFFRYELLVGLPDTLEALERVTIPYRVVCLKSPTLKSSKGVRPKAPG